jgi:hypothetical protein
VATIDDIYSLVHDGKRGGGRAETASGGVPIAYLVRKLGEIQTAQSGLAQAVLDLSAAVTAYKAVADAAIQPVVADHALIGAQLAELEARIAELEGS